MAYFSILHPAEPYLFKTAACRDIFHPNVHPRWIWVWDPCHRGCVKDFYQRGKMTIFESLLTPLEASITFWSCWSSSGNLLYPKIELPKVSFAFNNVNTFGGTFSKGPIPTHSPSLSAPSVLQAWLLPLPIQCRPYTLFLIYAIHHFKDSRGLIVVDNLPNTLGFYIRLYDW